ncbi:MAG: S8 family serine peptidase [Candidatus Lokiarchaeia archaeon]
MKICRKRTKNLILLITITVILSFSIFLAFNQQPIAQNPLTFPTQPTSPTTEDSKMGTHLQQLLQTFDPSTECEMIIFFEKTINYTQGIGLLKELGGFEIISNYTILNGICIKAPIGMAETIAQLNQVRSITYNEPIKLPPNQITTNEINTKDTQVNTIIGADVLQNPPYGLNGTGVVVAVIDSGINPHTYLDGSRIIYNESFVPDEGYTDLRDHGTAVAGIIGASSGTTAVGVAPAVNFLNLKVLDSYGRGEVDWLLLAVNEALNDTSHPKADIISLSLGDSSGRSNDDMCKAVNNAWVDDDTIVVAAAGNEGVYGYGTINSPGLGAYIITAGSTGGTDYRSISYFSSRGPTDDYGAKPDLVAPGEDLTTLSNNGYSIRTGFSGTSASTPVVSGAIALLLDNGFNGLPWLSPNTIKAALMMTAEDLGVNPFQQGAGLINISKTYNYLQDYYITGTNNTPPLIITPIRAIAYPMHLDDLTPTRLKLTIVVGNVTETPIINAYFTVSGNANAFTTVSSETFSNLNDTQEFVSVSFKAPFGGSVYDFNGELALINGSGYELFTIPLDLNDASFTDWSVSTFFVLLIMNNFINSENSILNAYYIGIGLVVLVLVSTIGIVWAMFWIVGREVPSYLELLSTIPVNYCPYCGNRVGDIDFFCYRCGRQIRMRSSKP